MGLATREERDNLEKVRENFMAELSVHGNWDKLIATVVELGDFTRCHGCGLTQDCFFKSLQRCSRCLMAAYHSRDCQVKHWGKHKAQCMGRGANRVGSGGGVSHEKSDAKDKAK